MPRLLLVLVLVHGLVPAFGEALELVADYGATGHVAHRETLPTDGTPGDEHGCGPTEHHCRCCTSQSVLPSATPGLVTLEPQDPPHTPFVLERLPPRPGTRLLRPPIRA